MLDIIIIGCGPSGMTAALYALRTDKKVLILEKEQIGGQISYSPRVENYPSIKAISGNEFANNLFEQIIDLGCQFELEEVIKIEKKDNIFYVTTNYNTYTSKACIVANGASHKKIKIAHEDELVGKGVSYCAICDGAFYKGEDVCLIGDGNSAIQYAILLSNYCSKVYVCTLFDKFFGESSLVKTLKEKTNIEIIQNVSLQEFIYDTNLTGLRFKNTITNEDLILNVPAAFIAIGQEPKNDIIKDLVDLTTDGYAITNDIMETKTPGLYVCGDTRKKQIRQLTTACGDGASASIKACEYIDKNF